MTWIWNIDPYIPRLLRKCGYNPDSVMAKDCSELEDFDIWDWAGFAVGKFKNKKILVFINHKKILPTSYFFDGTASKGFGMFIKRMKRRIDYDIIEVP